MIMCRICLSEHAPKKLSDLEEDIRDTHYPEVFMFCLGIEITDGNNISPCLCEICYEKLLEFYEFKQHALKNNNYLHSLESEAKDIKLESACSVKLEDLETAQADLKHEETSKVKLEISVDDDHGVGSNAPNDDPDDPQDLSDSEDEVLSALRQQKLDSQAKENKPQKGSKRKRKLPRPRQVCEECGRRVADLREHARVHAPRRARYACPQCARAFASYGGRRKHVLATHTGVRETCAVCQKVVKCLKTHTLHAHEPARLRHACASCPRRFATPSALAGHARAHSGERPFACAQCGATFRTKRTMQCHQRSIHEKEKTFLCQYCPNRFFKEHHLKIHVRSHTKERPYKCEECGKRFTSSTVLANHRALHADARPHACPTCERMFKNKTQLYNHLSSHAAERRHACGYCPARFKRSDHRARHEGTAHLKHAGLLGETG